MPRGPCSLLRMMAFISINRDTSYSSITSPYSIITSSSISTSSFIIKRVVVEAVIGSQIITLLWAVLSIVTILVKIVALNIH